MAFAASGWWSWRTVFLRRSTVYRAECGTSHVDFATPQEAERHAEIENRHVLSRRLAAPLINYPIV